jgi:serine/threonine-protein kinase
VLLTDFGIARRIDDVSNLTEDNVAVGTISYIAPEQLMGKPLDGRADQYALAATTFHLLTGAPPFQDSNRAVVISHHLGTPAPRISERRPDLAHLDAVLARALAKDADDRYPNCLAFARALTQQRPRRAGASPHPQPDLPTRPLGGKDIGGDGRPPTQRLERLVVHGTAHGVTQSASDAQGRLGTLSFRLVPHEPIEIGRGPIPVAMRAQLVANQLADGDEVEVSGVWDGATLDADTIVSLSAGAPPKRRLSPSRAEPTQDEAPKRKRGWTAALLALAGVIVLAGIAVVWFTNGFGASNRQAREGPIIKPVSASVFSPGGAPDNPQNAGLAIDGNPGTSWSTVTYKDAVPFPNFMEGEGLLLHLSAPTALSAVTIDLSSSGTEVQIRSSPTESPTKLADTSELVPTTPLNPGHNRIEVHNTTKTSNVLVWISKLGTTNGRSRTEISEITLQAAA